MFLSTSMGYFSRIRDGVLLFRENVIKQRNVKLMRTGLFDLVQARIQKNIFISLKYNLWVKRVENIRIGFTSLLD